MDKSTCTYLTFVCLVGREAIVREQGTGSKIPHVRAETEF